MQMTMIIDKQIRPRQIEKIERRKKWRTKQTNIMINIFLCYYSSFVFHFNISLRDFECARFKRKRGVGKIKMKLQWNYKLLRTPLKKSYS